MSLASDLQGLVDRVAQLESELSSAQAQVVSLQEQIAQKDLLISELQAQIASLQAGTDKIFSQAEADQMVASAKAELKEQLRAAYDSQQLSESESEAQIRALLQ